VLVKDIEYRRTTPAERQGPPRARRTNRDVGDWTNIVYVHTAPTPDPATKSNRAIMSSGLLSDEEAQYEPSTRTDDATYANPLAGTADRTRDAPDHCRRETADDGPDARTGGRAQHRALDRERQPGPCRDDSALCERAGLDMSDYLR